MSKPEYRKSKLMAYGLDLMNQEQSVFEVKNKVLAMNKAFPTPLPEDEVCEAVMPLIIKKYNENL